MTSAGYGWPQWQQHLQALGERRLVLVCGSRPQALAQAARLARLLAPESGVWVGPEDDRPHPALTTVAPGDGRRWLGRDVRLLVWDGWSGNPPDSQAAFAGNLVAGGLWIWLMPPQAEWGQFADPDYRRTSLDHASHHPYAARLARVLADDPAVIHLDADFAGERLPQYPASLALPAGKLKGFAVGATADQQRAVAAITATGLGRRRRPLVLTADRGRGKSAALGLAAASLLRQGRRRVLVTGPGPEAVQGIFRHAAMEGDVPLAADTADRLSLHRGELRYLPADELLRSQPEAEVLLVDEAAALPAPMLERLLLGWPRVVFATTVHGYEGSGRGFALRFRAVLDRETPHWQQLTLSQPIRWADSDPLEPLVNRLWMPAGDTSELTGADTERSDLRIMPWQPAQAPELELQQAFGLLLNAHYRTTPGDLRQWLDDPAAHTWVARAGDRIVGVLWGSEEGGLSPALADQVALGRRRLRGHLLAQSLAHHGAEPAAAVLRWLRVVRVAVEAPLRHQGLARALVAAAGEFVRTRGLDGLGTSFGADAGLLTFWDRCGLEPVRLGLRPEASTGEYAVQMLAATSPEATALQQRLATRFARHWPELLPVLWPGLPAELVLKMNVSLSQRSAQELDSQDRRELAAFTAGGRGLELSLPVLRRLSQQPFAARHLLNAQGEPEIRVWVRLVLQQQPLDTLRQSGQIQGRRQAEQQLRQLAGELLADDQRSASG